MIQNNFPSKFCSLLPNTQGHKTDHNKNRWVKKLKKWIEHNNTSFYFSNESKAGMEGPKFKSIYDIMNLFYMDLSKVTISTSLCCMKSTNCTACWPKAKLKFQQWTCRTILYSFNKCLLDVL